MTIKKIDCTLMYGGIQSLSMISDIIIGWIQILYIKLYFN